MLLPPGLGSACQGWEAPPHSVCAIFVRGSNSDLLFAICGTGERKQESASASYHKRRLVSPGRSGTVIGCAAAPDRLRGLQEGTRSAEERAASPACQRLELAEQRRQEASFSRSDLFSSADHTGLRAFPL